MDTGVSFAHYLNGMHNRIHPQFADAFLEYLDTLPPEDPRNDVNLSVEIEIVLDSHGVVVKMGVVRLSGVPEFDAAALEAIDRAGPLDPPPAAIASADGKTYVRWTFYRDEICACSTMFALPWILFSVGP